MSTSYTSIKNKGGMSVQVVACAYGRDPDDSYGRRQLYALDIAGSHTAVKAIWATVLSGGPLQPAGFARYKALRADKEADFLVMRSTPLEHVHHYHMIVEPKPTAPYLVITSQLGVRREETLARFLNTYTLYPVIDPWAEVVFAEGVRRKLVVKLETVGLEWAYRIETWGWDEVLDEAAKDGRLTFPAE